MPTGQFGQDLAALRAQTQMRPPVNPGGATGPMTGKTQPPKPGLRARVGELATGVAKGAGESVVGLGEMVHNTPVLGDLTDMLARMTGGNPDDAFGAAHQQLTARPGSMEGTGKTMEQIAEFFLPVKGTGAAKITTLPMGMRQALIKRLVSAIPNGASPEMMARLNKLAAIGGRVGGEAGSAALVSSIHGNDDPEAPAAVAGSGPLVGAGASGAASALNTAWGKELAPYLAALGTASVAPFTMPGLGAAMGSFGLTRMAARRLLKNPTTVPKIQRTLRSGAELGARGLGAVTDQVMPRRRLEQGQ